MMQRIDRYRRVGPNMPFTLGKDSIYLDGLGIGGELYYVFFEVNGFCRNGLKLK